LVSPAARNDDDDDDGVAAPVVVVVVALAGAGVVVAAVPKSNRSEEVESLLPPKRGLRSVRGEGARRCDDDVVDPWEPEAIRFNEVLLRLLFVDPTLPVLVLRVLRL